MTKEEKQRLDGLTAKQLYEELWELQQAIGAARGIFDNDIVNLRIRAFYIDLLFSSKMIKAGVDWQ